MLISAQRFLIPGEIDKTYPFPVSHNNTCLSFPLFNYEYPPTSPSDGTSCTIANVAYRPTHRRQVYHSQGSLSLTQRPRSYVETASDIEQFDVALALSGENAFASRVYWQTFHTHTQHWLQKPWISIIRLGLYAVLIATSVQLFRRKQTAGSGKRSQDALRVWDSDFISGFLSGVGGSGLTFIC